MLNKKKKIYPFENINNVWVLNDSNDQNKLKKKKSSLMVLIKLTDYYIRVYVFYNSYDYYVVSNALRETAFSA